jgi:hypothetical protein
MESARKKRGIGTRTIGTAGAIAAACAAGCISLPLIAPVLAWLGISSLGAVATGWYLAMAGLFAAGLGLLILFRRRSCPIRAQRQSSGTCGCSSKT